MTTPDCMTFEQFLTDPNVPEHSEWVGGKVVELDGVNRDHCQLTCHLIAILGLYVDDRQLGCVLIRPFQTKLLDSSRAPDLLVVLAENVERVKANYLDGPADLVVEVISPGSAGRDRGEKYFEYESAGVPEYWLIDPKREVAEFYRLDERGIYTAMQPDADGRLHSTAVPGLWIRVEWLWTRPCSIDVAREWGLI